MLKKALIYHCNDREEKSFKTNINIDSNRIVYKDDISEVLYDIKEEKLIRENKGMYLELDFKKEIGNIYLKDEGKSLNIEIDLKKLEFNDKSLEIIYMIDNNKVIYKIDME